MTMPSGADEAQVGVRDIEDLRGTHLARTTAVAGRDHLESLRQDPRLTLVVDNRGTPLPGRRMVAVQCDVVVHDDRAVEDWFYESFAGRMAAEDPAAFVRLLDSPGRAVLQALPTGKRTSHDSRRIAGNGRGGTHG